MREMNISRGDLWHNTDMIDNYDYFIVISESSSISEAAEKLFLSHQALSLYLKNLEQRYRTSFFERSPRLRLTPAGQAFLEAAREMQFIEQNLQNRIKNLEQDDTGTIRFGTTEGRYRILIPRIMAEFRRMYPRVKVITDYGTTSSLREAVLENHLDFVLLNEVVRPHKDLSFEELLEERMNLVISDDLLKQYFPREYPACISRFREGVDLAEFSEVPFVLAKENKNSRTKLEVYLSEYHNKLHTVMELMQSDVHYMLTAQNYAASFCWDMYVPSIHRLNRCGEMSRLHVFPLMGRDINNRLILVQRKGKICAPYETAFCRLLRQLCRSFQNPALEEV